MNNFGKLIIKSVITDVDEKYIKNKKDIGPNLNEVLKNKYIKVGKDEEKYIELLRYNIIYYKSIIKKLEVIIEMWVQNGVISGPSSVDKSIANITNSSKEYVNNAMRKGQSYLNEKDKKIFSSYDNNSGLKRIEKVENDYRILNVYKDILGMVINSISKDAVKYNGILDMSIEQLKIDIMNEIFAMINEILFSEEHSEESKYEDEALVDEQNSEVTSIDDEEKCLSFKKYVSMISSPEISVRINDVFRDAVELENIDEDEAFLFNEDFKDYVSCVVLLMDYVSAENRSLLKNSFRLYVLGYVNEYQFEETVDKIIIDKTFMDKRSWFECQKLVKSDFNLENNNFFSNDKVSEDESGMDLDSRVSLIEKLTDDMTVDECISYFKYSKPRFGMIDEHSDEGVNKLADKFKKGLFNFSERLKSKTDYEDEFDEGEFDDFEEFDDEDSNHKDGYDEYDDEYEDEDDYEENRTGGFASRLKGILSRNKKYDEYDEYDEDEEFDEYNVEIDPNIFKGDTSIQDENALAILMMREKQKRKEDSILQAKKDELKTERKIAEEINKNGVGLFKHKDIVLSEEDFIYKKQNHNYRTKNEELFDDIIEGQMTFDDINRNSEEVDVKYVDGLIDDENADEVIQFNPILGHTQRLNLLKLQKQLEENESKGINKEVDLTEKENQTSVDTSAFEELEAMKSMDPEEISNVIKLHSVSKAVDNDKLKSEVDKVVYNEKILSEQEDEDVEDTFEEEKQNELYQNNEVYKEDVFDSKVIEDDTTDDDFFEEDDNESKVSLFFTDFKTKIQSGIENRKREKEDRIDDSPVFSKPKMIRDGIIIIAILVLVFSVYVYVIKGFTRPTVDETNNRTKQTQQVKDSKNTAKPDVEEKSTTEISKKTEEEKEKDEIEAKASALDREAENYKAGKGAYYTVFVGAVKSEDAAQTYANNFNSRGVKAAVIRNGGYYMLKVGEYFNVNDAYNESARITNLGIQNYVATRNKYYDLKIEAFKVRSAKLSAEQMKTDYNDLKNQISSTGKSEQYVQNLDEVYNEALKNKQ